MTEHIERVPSRTQLSAAKQALLKKRLQGKRRQAHEPAQTIPRRISSEPGPLSFAQQRLWFLAQLEPTNTAYQMPLAFHLRGALNVTALEQSVANIVQRHETLRTTFPMVDGAPAQVTSSVTFTLPVVDLRDLPAPEREAEVQRLFAAETQHHFDLTQEAGFRAQLLCLSDVQSVLLLTIHHIIFDEWSYDVFCRELATLYEAFCHQQPVMLPELPIQYRDFAMWQRERMQGEAFDTQLAYWQHQLDGAPHAIDLPTDRPRPAVQEGRGGQLQVYVPKALCQSLKDLGQRQGATLFMTLLAAFNVLLFRYTNQTDVVVGTPITNRSRAETEPLIGLFLNMLALRTGLSGTPSFREVLARVRDVALDGYTHQDLPFERLVEALRLERDASRSPVFQTMFILQNTNLFALQLPGLTIERSEFGHRSVVYDLTLFLNERSDGLHGAFDYNADLFDAVTIERMARHFQVLLENIVAAPDQSIAALPVLTEAERRQQLVEWNATTIAYPLDESLMQRFEAQVQQTPQATAFGLGGATLEYGTLNRRANQVAHYLQTLGMGPTMRVGLCIERSFEAMIGLLGIFKAGGVYVPLDPAYPPERLAFMLEDAEVSFVLTQERLLDILPQDRAAMVCLDADRLLIAQHAEDNPTVAVAPEDLAYIIYTSGSTGQPKGAAVPHKQILNRLRWMWDAYPFAPDEVSCQKTALNFVDSIWEVFGPLLQGSPTVIIPDHVLQDPIAFVRALGAQGVTRLWLVPSLLRVMLDTFPALQRQLPQLTFWVTSGEPLPVELLQRFHEAMSASVLYNLYGTSEVWDVTWYEPEPHHHHRANVPIGRPISNMYTFILDADLEPVPVGVIGEFYVSGIGLAQGYLNRPDLNAQNFVANPFPPLPHGQGQDAHLYKTGDLARYLPDGTIEFVGRVDYQVKIRGFRIELGEIEATLNQHRAIRQAVVLAREETRGDQRLVAYVIPERGPAPTPSALQQFLARKLPAYMVPAVYVMLDTLPLTPSGKINRLALPAPEQRPLPREQAVVPARNRLERQLVAMWEDLLHIQPIGIRDNFFALGGHSLLAVRLFAQIEKTLGEKLSLATLLQAPTVEQLADILRQEEWAPRWSSLVAIQPGGAKLPFFLVHAGKGNVLFYHDLAQYLGPDQPVYGLQIQGLDGQLPFHDRVEDMAAHYLSEIRTVQPEGPYLLGGWCFGCFVAFEMGQQLHTQGQPVAFLALIDPVVPPTLKSLRYRVRYCVNNLPHPVVFLRHVLGLSSRWTTRKTTKLLAQVFQRLQTRYSFTAFDQLTQALVDAAPQDFPGRECISRARRRYVPRVYPGRLSCFVDRERAPLSPYPWPELAAGGVEWLTVPGNHGIVFQEPHVRGLAEQLRACLERSI